MLLASYLLKTERRGESRESLDVYESNPAEHKRLHYIDWLRVAAVLLLIPFHSARVFDVWEPFYAKNAGKSAALSTFLAVVNLWHMPLLFLLAGTSTWLAIRKRSGKEYRRERLLRLGVPLIFGVLVIVPPQAWFGAMTNTGYSGGMFQYLASGRWHFDLTRPDYFGFVSPAHLWFVLFLLVIALATQPLLHRLRERPGSMVVAVDRLSSVPGGLLLLAVPLLVLEGLPDLDGKNIFTYAGFYIVGALLFACPACLNLEKQRSFYLVLGLAGVAVAIPTWPLVENLPDPSVPVAAHALLRLATALAVIFAALGWGRRLLDRDSKVLTYASEASYPFYILHQTIIVALGFVIVKLGWGVAPKYGLLVVASLAATVAVYEIGVRRFNPVRFLFGMRPKARGYFASCRRYLL